MYIRYYVIYHHPHACDCIIRVMHRRVDVAGETTSRRNREKDRKSYMTHTP